MRKLKDPLRYGTAAHTANALREMADQLDATKKDDVCYAYVSVYWATKEEHAANMDKVYGEGNWELA